MDYLADNRFNVIALRDLARYVDPAKFPTDPQEAIKERQAKLRSP